MPGSSNCFMSLSNCVNNQKICDITYSLNIVLYFSTSTCIASSTGSLKYIYIYIMLALNVCKLFDFFPIPVKIFILLTAMIWLLHLMWDLCKHAVLF